MTTKHREPWAGAPSMLWLELWREARQQEPGKWAHRSLDNGIIFAVRRHKDGRRELRIARKKDPKNEKDESLWTGQLHGITYGLKMDILDGTVICRIPGDQWWTAPLQPEDKGEKHVRRWLELRTAECRPGISLCAPCSYRGDYNEVEWQTHLWTQNRCDECQAEYEAAKEVVDAQE